MKTRTDVERERAGQLVEEMNRPGSGYLAARLLPDGSIAALVELMYTRAICLGITDQVSYARRFCFKDRALAVSEWEKLQSEEDTPTGFVARRPELRDRWGNYLGAAICQCQKPMAECERSKCVMKPGYTPAKCPEGDSN